MSIKNETAIYLVLKSIGSTDDVIPIEAWRNEIDADDQAEESNDNLTKEEDEDEVYYFVERIILKGYDAPHVD